jgi:hypothetical protein
MSKRDEALKLAQDWYDSGNENHDDFAKMIKQVIALAEQPAQQEQQEPVAWRDHVEQRLLTWRQSFVNKSGDQLALDDFMDKRSLDDLIDFVCDEYTSPPASKPLTDEEIKRLKPISADFVSFRAGVRCMEREWKNKPASKPWVGLTEEQKAELVFELFNDGKAASKAMYLLTAHEAKLKEKNIK